MIQWLLDLDGQPRPVYLGDMD